MEQRKVRVRCSEREMQPHLAGVCMHKGVDARKTLQTQSCRDQLDALFARPEGLGAARRERRHSVMLLHEQPLDLLANSSPKVPSDGVLALKVPWKVEISENILLWL